MSGGSGYQLKTDGQNIRDFIDELCTKIDMKKHGSLILDWFGEDNDIDNVEDFEIASNTDGKVFLTLRQPLIESFHAINNARNNTTPKQITLENVKEPTWKDSLPFGFIFLGVGFSSKGILRSDSVTTALGLISILTGWILKSKENNKNIS